MNYNRLDSYGDYPSGLREYLQFNGWHFNKKMCEWAVSGMYKEDSSGNKVVISPYRKSDVDTILSNNGVVIKNINNYDYIYIANMCKADFLNSSVPNERQLAKFVKDVIDDADGYEGMPFTRFYADCIGKGISIPWEEVI